MIKKFLPLLMAFWLFNNLAEAAIPAKLRDEHWTVSNEKSHSVIDHGDWQKILDGYLEVAKPVDYSVEVQTPRRLDHNLNRENDDRTEIKGKHHGRRKQITRFDYDNMRAADRQILEKYIEQLQKTIVTDLNRDEQRAFWVNLYNALMVQQVVAHLPLDDIRDKDFQDDPLVTIETRPLSLNQIRDGILRPIWRDPRLLYVLHQPALGSPDLAPTAFSAANGEEVLEDAARKFINHPRAATIRGVVKNDGIYFGESRLIISSIYLWFQADFGNINNDHAVINHLRHYARDELRDALDGASTLSDDQFEWRLDRVTDED